MGIPLKLVPPRDKYIQGWGQECLDPRPIVRTWELTVHDRKGHPFTIYFDLVNGSSPLVIGLDIGRYSDSINLTKHPFIRINRPHDRTCHEFNTYIAPDSEHTPDCIRMRVDFISKPLKPITSMLSSFSDSVHDNPKLFARRLHRYTHVHPEQLKSLCQAAGILNSELEEAIDTTASACELCVRNGRPLPSKKVSLNHVNEAFNEEVQVDFTDLIIYEHQTANSSIKRAQERKYKFQLLIITDISVYTGSGYSEGDIAEQKNAATITDKYENLWLCRHGASANVSADDEYHRTSVTQYFDSHNINFKARPTRRHNKIGFVERKNQTIKSIIRRLAMEHSDIPIRTLVSRGIFLSNMFSGSQILSSFELVRGYQPSVLGIPPTYVTQELLSAHMCNVAMRALQRVLRSRTPDVPTAGMFQPGDRVWVSYASSKNNEPDEWIETHIEAVHPHYLEVRRIKDGKPVTRGRTTKPAYEDVRVAPQNDLTRRLMSCSLEQELVNSNSSERGVETETSDEETVEDVHDMEDIHQPEISTLMTGVATQKGPRDDIGEYADKIGESQKEIYTTLKSEKARVLDELYEQVGSQQLSRCKMDPYAPPWLFDDAFDKEYDANWKDAYVPVHERDVPADANMITSHTIYKVKTQETGERDFKARVIPHGNRDDEKDSIRKDSATAQLNVIRLLLSIVTFLGFRLAMADIKGAYLQSGPIQRDTYVRPPREWTYKQDKKRGGPMEAH